MPLAPQLQTAWTSAVTNAKEEFYGDEGDDIIWGGHTPTGD